MNKSSGLTAVFGAPTASDFIYYVLGLLRRTAYMVARRDLKKLGYLLLQLYSWRANVKERCLIDKCKRTSSGTKLKRVKAAEIVFGHDVGADNDDHLQARIRLLSSIPPGHLTDDIFNRLCPSDGPVEICRGVALNGNGRVYALVASGHGDYMIQTVEFIA